MKREPRSALDDRYPVVIVGGGPAGITAACLLADYGVECLVLDRWKGVYPQPRAVHLDDEVSRILARVGLAAEFASISRPARGLALIDREHSVLAQFQRESGCGSSGFAQANMFDQPELEMILREGAASRQRITLCGEREVTCVVNEKDNVRIEFVDCLTGNRGYVRASYVLGCDGANSAVRASIGSRMSDLGFEQRWLVVDISTVEDLGQWDGVHQLCDPLRPGTYMRIGDVRYRWEFRLWPGESAENFRDIDTLHPLISRWTGEVPKEKLNIVRVAEYTFRAQLAERWRDRRAFLLGDAAHLTPPFIGQGMGAGLRDAMNLTWKIVGVLNGTLPPTILDTYEQERKPHARSLIRRAIAVGFAMTEGGDLGIMLRRLIAPQLGAIPGLIAKFTNSTTPALSASALNHRSVWCRSLAGSLCPNTLVDSKNRLDDAYPSGFMVVTILDATEGQRREIECRGAVLVTAKANSELARWLESGHTKSAIVRPDRTVMRTSRSLSSLYTYLPVFGGPRTAV